SSWALAIVSGMSFSKSSAFKWVCVSKIILIPPQSLVYNSTFFLIGEQIPIRLKGSFPKILPIKNYKTCQFNNNFIFCSIAFFATIYYSIVTLFKKKTKETKKMYILYGIILLLLFLLIYMVFIEPRRLLVKYFFIRKNKTKVLDISKAYDLYEDQTAITIAHLSDFHFSRFYKPRRINRVIASTMTNRPDIIVFTGDLI